MNVLPHAIALANIHIGTMAGKLNGVIPADDAERLADLVDVDAARDLLGVAALHEVRRRRSRTRGSRGRGRPRRARPRGPCRARR